MIKLSISELIERLLAVIFCVYIYICLICWMILNDAFLSSGDTKEWTETLGICDEKSCGLKFLEFVMRKVDC